MKIAVICSDFQKSNIRKQPWKYVYEIAKYLGQIHEIFIITDSNKKNIDGFRIISINNLFVPFKGESEELLNILEQENPDKCIMLLGLTSFLRREFKIKKPVIGVFTSPIYSFNELIRNIGIKDSIKYRKYTTIHFINALIPKMFVKKWANKFESIVFLSNATKKKLIEKGMSNENAFLIPTGIDKHFLELPRKENIERLKKEINPENIPVIMYFTSPLSLRGTDTLIKAFAKVRKEMACKLIFLSRMDYKELSKEESILKEIADKENINNSVEIISEYLSPEEIKKYISVADVICLPFKIVISDVPVSILEAMALKKPVISTKVACILEILDGRGITVDSNNPKDLANAIVHLLNNRELLDELGDKSSKYMAMYPNWPQVGKEFIKIV